MSFLYVLSSLGYTTNFDNKSINFGDGRKELCQKQQAWENTKPFARKETLLLGLSTALYNLQLKSTIPQASNSFKCFFL